MHDAYMCVCVCMCVCIRVCTCMCACMQMCVHDAYMCACMHGGPGARARLTGLVNHSTICCTIWSMYTLHDNTNTLIMYSYKTTPTVNTALP